MNTTWRPAAWWASTRLRLQVPHTKQAGLPLGKAMVGTGPSNRVSAVTTGIHGTPSAASAGSMKNPNPSDTTSTGIPAARAASANATNPGSCGCAAALAMSWAGSAVIRPTSQCMSLRDPTMPSSYAATYDSQSAVTNSAMSVSLTSVCAIVPS